MRIRNLVTSWFGTNNKLVLAVISPILAAIFGLTGYLWVNRDRCPEIAKNYNTNELTAISDNINSIKSGESNVYLKNKRLFKKLEDEKNIDLQNKIKDKIISEYFRNNNSDIFDYLTKNHQLINSNNEFIGVTYLSGSAGIGKSFIRNPIRELYGDKSCVIRLSQEIQSGKNYGSSIKSKPQLVSMSEDLILSMLPNIEESGKFDLGELLRQSNCISNNRKKKVVLIDDLDEIHPDSSELLLKSIDTFLSKQENTQKYFLHFIVFGRPEAFATWLSHPHHQFPNNFKKFIVKGPGYTHTSDISLMSSNYFLFRKNELKPDSIDDTLLDLIKNKPFLHHTYTNNLANGNFVISSIIGLDGSSDIAYKARLFEEFLIRNSESHNRPFEGKNGKLYEYLLQNIAEKYSNKIDEQGYFEVNSNDFVPVIEDFQKQSYDVLKLQENKKCTLKVHKFNIQQTLEYSGVVDVVPIDENIKKYRFAPFWLHEFLVSQRRIRN